MKKVGYSVGVFDLFHKGHDRFIRSCLCYVDELIIGVHTDKFTESYKCRPKQVEDIRLSVIKKKFPNLEVFLIDGNHRKVYEKYNITHVIHGDDWSRESYLSKIGLDDFNDFNLSLILLPHTNGIHSSFLREKKHYLDGIKACIIDVDGTISLSGKLIKGAKQTLDKIMDIGIDCYIYSNNTSEILAGYYHSLGAQGIDVNRITIYSPISELISYLNENKIKNILALAPPEVCQFLTDNDFNVDSNNPNFIVLAYDKTLNYEKLAKASYFLNKGVLLIATNPDKSCPTVDGPLPDVGSFLALFKASLGVTPHKILGKPNNTLIRKICSEKNINASEVMVIGDRLPTDVAMANNAGSKSILVLSGSSTLTMVKDSAFKPTYIIDDISILLEQYKY